VAPPRIGVGFWSFGASLIGRIMQQNIIDWMVRIAQRIATMRLVYTA
jgi:hypothetical protein